MANRRYSSVQSMVRDSAEAEFADRLDRHLAARRLVTELVAARGAQGLSQQDIAVRMKCSQRRVSTLESSTDADLRMRDAVAYAEALGLEVKITLVPGRRSVPEQIEYHAAGLPPVVNRNASDTESREVAEAADNGKRKPRARRRPKT